MTDPQSELDVEGIRARERAATPGPWEADEPTPDEPTYGRCILGGGVPGSADEHAVASVASYGQSSDEVDADAEFIAHARTDIPALLDALEKVSAERDGWRVLVETDANMARWEAAEARLSEVEEALRAMRYVLSALVRDHETLVLEITERHDGVEYPVDGLGYADLPPDYLSALAHSGDTSRARALLPTPITRSSAGAIDADAIDAATTVDEIIEAGGGDHGWNSTDGGQ